MANEPMKLDLDEERAVRRLLAAQGGYHDPAFPPLKGLYETAGLARD